MKFFNKFNFFKKSSKVSAILTTGQTTVVYKDRDYENFAKESYMKNSIAFKCVFEIAKAVSSVPWKLKKRNNGKIEEIEEHPFLDLLKRPNPQDGFAFLMLKATAYLAFAGNSYMERIKPETGPNKSIPKELYTHRPDRMTIHTTEDGKINFYEYDVNGNKIKWDIDLITGQSDILHFKSFHPLDDWYGLSATEPVAREIDISNDATDWNKKLLQNECKPGMVFTTESNLTDKQYARLEKMLNEKHTGPENVGKSLIIEGQKAVAKPYGWSPAEMDFINGDREISRKICNGYSVPPMLIGIPGDITYSNYKEARLAFWEDTVIFYLNYFQTEFNNWFFNDEENKDYFLAYDLNKIAALAPKREALWERIEKANFLTHNEKRKELGYDEIEGGDVILVPATMMPLTALTLTDEEKTESITKSEELAIEKLIKDGFTRKQAEKIVLNYDYDDEENGKDITSIKKIK